MSSMNVMKNAAKLKGKAGKYCTDVIFQYFTDKDIFAFKQGEHFALYKKFGAHPITHKGKKGVYFSTWAPHAKTVSVLGDFNKWKKGVHCLNGRDDHSGIWEGFIADVKKGDAYQYFIDSKKLFVTKQKMDPFGFYHQGSPGKSSVVWNLHYRWQDQTWMKRRQKNNSTKSAISVYEVHLGSWKREGKGGGARHQTYREMAETMVDYALELGFTHIEFMPVMEHPFYGSWGYQALGFFAPTSRYGTPQDFMYLIDRCHQKGLGVILDWVPSHFPADNHGLAKFDGTNLFEEKGVHPDWKSCTFNLGRLEVVDFLISNALFWLEKYHVDGIRVDAVASMLYLDYSRRKGQWTPNFFGGYENLDAVAFIRRLNQAVKKRFPDTLMIAEESTCWPAVSRSTSEGGLDFCMKWNMGWMHDTLQYFRRQAKYRHHHNKELAFCFDYAFSEDYLLSLSHDEVVYEKSSLLSKMPGKDWEKFANLRALFGFMFAHPGKKLLFMGGEFGQWKEWNHDAQLSWELLEHKRHQQMRAWVKDLNVFYKKEKVLSESDFSSKSFQWITQGGKRDAIFSFIRKSQSGKSNILVVCNLKKRAMRSYRLGVPQKGRWREVLNSDAKDYFGKGHLNRGVIASKNIASGDFKQSICLTLPPLSVIFLKLEEK